jgi:nucleoside-diphosphate-sugar epimerase
MSNTRILLTGATGVVGQIALPALIAAGHRVTAVGRTPESRAGLAALGADAIAAGVSRFVQASFAPVYEDGGDQWIDERWPQRPAPYKAFLIAASRSWSPPTPV